MNPAILLLGLVIAAAAAAFVASLPYAGLYYAFDHSTWMFQALQDDMLASYRVARLDLAAGDWHRSAIAAAAGLFAGGGHYGVGGTNRGGGNRAWRRRNCGFGGAVSPQHGGDGNTAWWHEDAGAGALYERCLWPEPRVG